HTGVTNLNTNAGADLVNVQTISGATTVSGGDDTDTINVGSNAAGTPASPNTNTGGNVNSISALLTINGNAPSAGSDVLNVDDSVNTINVGSLAPAVPGVVNGIQGAVSVVGGGADVMTVDDTGSTTAKTGMLTETALTGLGMGPAGITYSGLAEFDLNLGTGG